MSRRRLVFSLIPTVHSGEHRFAGIYWRTDWPQYGGLRRLVAKLPVFIWYGDNYDAVNDHVNRGWWVLLAGFVKSRNGVEWHADKAAIGSQKVRNVQH